MGQLGENNVRHTIGDPDIPDEGVATPPHSDTGSNHDDMDDSSRQAAAPVPATAPHLPTTLDEEEFMRTNLPPLGKYEAEGWGAFHWEIDNWTALGDKVTSGEFTVAGHKWDILLFPRGNQAEDMVSLYVEYKAADGMADDWHACANFCLAMSNTSDPSVFTHNVAQHRFTADESDWGFTRFMGLRQLMTPTDADTPALLENNRVRISAYVRVIKDTTGVLWHNFHNYDSRKQTGFVGLRNQGATCYMNSLLQSLYFTNEFRSAVYQIPTENDDPKKSVALALQRVFYNLEHSSEAVDTTELTKSFGWDSLESFMQHDVQEFNRVLQDNLETKMKGTAADGAIARLFEGKMKSFIRCVDVDYESSRVENYYDISLNVKGCATLRDSFANYCEVEMLEGENRYQAEGHGLQDAKKGVIFESFPPVLQLQLKRFEYDFMHDAMVKINDRHEFPQTIDLEEFLSDDADRSMPWRYALHGVLVHSGDLHGGHYFGLLRPKAEDKWFRFDDDRVIPITRDEVFDDYFGGEIVPTVPGPGMRRAQAKRFTNAYMLVYIREALRDQVLASGDIQPPAHLLRRIAEAKAEAERRRREKEELLHTLPVSVVNDSHVARHQGFDLSYFDERQPADNAIFSERMRKNMLLSEFKALYAARLGCSPDDFRLWLMVGRVNKTVRCDVPLVTSAPGLTLAQVKDTRSSKWPSLRLYCEMRTPDSPPGFLTEPPPAGMCLLHAKFYDPATAQISGVGHLYVQSSDKVGDIKPRLCEMAGLPADTPLQLFEEIKPTLIEPMNTALTFSSAEIQTGDIICFQVDGPADDSYTLPDVVKFFEDVHHRVRVKFVPKPASQDADEFGADSASDDAGGAATEAAPVTLALSTRTPYAAVAARVAAELGARDPNKLRFHKVSPVSQLRVPVEPTPTSTLSDMLPPSYYTQNNSVVDGLREFVVMYERLEVTLEKLGSMRSVRVTYVGKRMKEEHVLEVLVPKAAPSQALVEATYDKVEAALRAADKQHAPKPLQLNFYEVTAHRIVRQLDGSEPMDQVARPAISEVVAIHASVADPEATAKMDIDDQAATSVEVFHFTKDLVRTHSVPFLFSLIPGEPWKDTWARLSAKLSLGEKELKNMGVVYGPPGTQDLAACRWLQGVRATDSVMSPASTGQHTPDSTPPPPQQPQADEADDSLCLYDVATRGEGPAPLGFIALDHIDRVSRHRNAHHERAIRILN